MHTLNKLKLNKQFHHNNKSEKHADNLSVVFRKCDPSRHTSGSRKAISTTGQLAKVQGKWIEKRHCDRGA